MKLIKSILSVFILSAFGSYLTSCGPSIYMARYDVKLSSVESPSDIKTPFGENKITKVSEEITDNKNKPFILNKYEYTDEYIGITWYYNTTQLEFELKNLSEHTLKINWDDISYMDYHGNVSRIMHKGVKYAEREQPQGSISIPKGGRISDIIVPINNVYFDSGVSGLIPAQWKQTAMIPCYYNKKEVMERDITNKVWIGLKIRVLFPIEIEGVKNDYNFEFTVDSPL